MIVVHGSVGVVEPERSDRLRAGVRAAATAGNAVLERGGGALDAVVAAVRVLEDDPEFGAGRGSALTRDGTVETCASVMDGARRRAGAVAAVPDLATPVVVARAMLEVGEHVILAGGAALRFAAEIGLQAAPPGSLATPRALAQLRDAGAAGAPPADIGGVGAVAVDRNGTYAAATSGAGAVARRAGCVDDASVPGVGSWADGCCAVSTTGAEALFRVALAHEIAMKADDGSDPRRAIKAGLADLRGLLPDAMAGAIAVGRNSWCALQLGPAMPVAWVDASGPGDAIGFSL